MPLQTSSVLTLPVELLRRIVDMAIDDGRWEDLTTLFSIVRVCRAFYDVAAPLYWRSINLRKSYQYKPDDFLDTFSLRTRSFIRSVITKANTWVPVTANECATFAQIILALPNVEEIPVSMLDVYEQGSPGAAMYDELAATVCHNLSSLEFEIVPAEAPAYGQKRTVPPNIDLSAARGILTYLDPARLRKLDLPGELTQAGAEGLGPLLQTFVHLEQYRLYVLQFDLALLTNATLEVVLVDDAIFDSWSFRSEMSSMLELRRTHDIMLLLPGECEHLWWSDLRSPDFYQRAKKTGGIGVISDDMLHGGWELVREY